MSESAPDLGAMVSKLLSDPTLMSQIASTVGLNSAAAAAPEAEEKPPQENESKPASASAGGLDGIIPMLSMFGGGHSVISRGGGAARRTALLAALKPFCNEHRCRTIDYMIGISKLSETLTSSKGDG